MVQAKLLCSRSTQPGCSTKYPLFWQKMSLQLHTGFTSLFLLTRWSNGKAISVIVQLPSFLLQLRCLSFSGRFCGQFELENPIVTYILLTPQLALAHYGAFLQQDCQCWKFQSHHALGRNKLPQTSRTLRRILADPSKTVL